VKNPRVKLFLERLAQADPRPDSLLHLLDTVVSGCVCVVSDGGVVGLRVWLVRVCRGRQIPGQDLYENALRYDGRKVSPLHA
jgi:hypothetical protein